MLKENETFIICELSQTHEGNLDIAKTLIKAAAEAKADAVKFQVFQADELAVAAYQHYALFKKLEWTKDQWTELIDLAHSLKLKAFADVFGLYSAHMLASIGIDGIKIHATDIRNRPLLEAFSTFDVPLFLSCGGAYLEELREAVSILQSKGKKRPLILLHGFQSYPTLIEDTRLAKMRFFGEQLGLPYGFADHIDGDHEQNFSLCAMAVGMGAGVIEKHITLDRAKKMEDYESALNPGDFVDFVRKMRDLDKAKGAPADDLSTIEQGYRKSTRKHVVAVKPIAQGAEVKADSVALKRAVNTAEPFELEKVLGRRALKNISIDEAILAQDVQ